MPSPHCWGVQRMQLAAVIALACLVTASMASWPPVVYDAVQDISVEIGLQTSSHKDKFIAINAEDPGRAFMNTMTTLTTVDWDGDKEVDLVVTNPHRNEVRIYYFTSHSFHSDKYEAFTFSETILWAHAADFNRDGYIDLLLQHGGGNAHIWYGGQVGKANSIARNVFSSKISNTTSVSLVVLTGECGGIDVMGRSYDEKQSIVMRNTLTAKRSPDSCNGPTTGRATFDKFVVHESDAAGFSMSVSNVDVNGDCRADIVFTTPNNATSINVNISILRNHIKGSEDYFYASTVFTVPNGTGVVTMRDMTGDGQPDAVIPYLFDDSKQDSLFDSILIVHGRLHASNICPDEKCCVPHKYSYASVSREQIAANPCTADYCLLSPASSCGKPGMLINQFEYSQNGRRPVALQIGDFNADTFNDLLFRTEHEVVMLVKKDGAPSNFACVRHRINVLDPSGVPFFADFDSDGSLDFMTSSNVSGVRGYWNGLDTDGYFLTAYATNGATGDYSGAWQVGAVHTFFYSDLHMNRVHLQGAQQSSTAYSAFQLPHAAFGLGRTYSYIEYYYCGMHLVPQQGHFMSWANIVPNSQLLCIPSPLNKPDSWLLELFISPSKWIFLVGLGVVISLVLLAVPIAVLKYQEVQADREEAQALLH